MKRELGEWATPELGIWKLSRHQPSSSRRRTDAIVPYIVGFDAAGLRMVRYMGTSGIDDLFARMIPLRTALCAPAVWPPGSSRGRV
ncbi:hypothetical protein N7517_004705 [Penicillium concentricum]|uniref:Uncharacterized protein n=1 Tax=Penicillium concentricum TaxID=293559 RepID=A0A9W9V9M4_9EURO|nr:uncharacterized protein N7517_004705 [Penicillium concentricum]KAJ5372699.1 hypothetical protein N7517_004705 [Penicillium concentricum]